MFEISWENVMAEFIEGKIIMLKAVPFGHAVNQKWATIDQSKQMDDTVVIWMLMCMCLCVRSCCYLATALTKFTQ